MTVFLMLKMSTRVTCCLSYAVIHVEKSKKKSSTSSNPIAAIATIVSGKPIRKTSEPETAKAAPSKKDGKPNAPAKPATAVIPSKVSEKMLEKKVTRSDTTSGFELSVLYHR